MIIQRNPPKVQPALVMTTVEIPTIDDVRAAANRISDAVHFTPVLSSQRLSDAAGTEVMFKSEHLQKAGAFKARGACNAVLGLDDETAARGVATHSSGNHGAALAMAASNRGITAHIVMPSNAPTVKRDAVQSYGGLVIECEPNLEARETTLARVVAQTGAHIVPPYDDARVIAGQGTVGMEILEQVPDVEALAIPVGGGGLLGGVALAVKTLKPSVTVVAVEPAGADDAFRSFGLGRIIPQTSPNTIADGLLTSLGELNFALMQQFVDTVVTVSDEAIVAAMRLQWSRMKQVIEPSGAVSYAGILEHPEQFRGRKTVAVVSGGNLDLNKLPW